MAVGCVIERPVRVHGAETVGTDTEDQRAGIVTVSCKPAAMLDAVPLLPDSPTRIGRVTTPELLPGK